MKAPLFVDKQFRRVSWNFFPYGEIMFFSYLFIFISEKYQLHTNTFHDKRKNSVAVWSLFIWQIILASDCCQFCFLILLVLCFKKACLNIRESLRKKSDNTYLNQQQLKSISSIKTSASFSKFMFVHRRWYTFPQVSHAIHLIVLLLSHFSRH